MMDLEGFLKDPRLPGEWELVHNPEALPEEEKGPAMVQQLGSNERLYLHDNGEWTSERQDLYHYYEDPFYLLQLAAKLDQGIADIYQTRAGQIRPLETQL